MNNQYTPEEKVKRNYPEYFNWRSMIKRVNCPQSSYYKMELFDQWYDFFAFLTYIGRKPGPTYTIDRLDNSKGYVPGNIQWATKSAQMINRNMMKNNSTGVRGVSIRRGKYRAIFRRKELGLYSTIKEAELAYNEARRSHIKNEKE